MIFNQWLQEKPDFDQECIVITQNTFSGELYYRLQEVKIRAGRLMLLDHEGYRWGLIDDLQADRYFIIQTK
jgi:hypothetical protein